MDEGCRGMQFTINALSGERQAPPKTEDGTDTEDVDPGLAMVYVRIHTGASLPEELKPEEPGCLQDAVAAAAAAAAVAAATDANAAGTSSAAATPAAAGSAKDAAADVTAAWEDQGLCTDDADGLLDVGM